MDPGSLVEDAASAGVIIKDLSKLIKPLVSTLSEAGTDIQSPELRLKCTEDFLEYTAGLRFRERLWTGSHATLRIPPPRRFRIYSLFPYEAIDGCHSVTENGVVLNRDGLKDKGDSFRVELEYDLEGSQTLSGLVFTSSPADTVALSSDTDIQRFWLHSELKSLDFLKSLYRRVRVEDLDVQVDVTLREEIRDAITPEFRREMMMLAKFQSEDRNEQARAIAYRRHHLRSRYSGNFFAAMQAAEELVQPSRFRRFLSLEGPYRLSKCTRGPDFSDAVLPVSLPHSMLVYSTTDLTLEEPAKEGKLIYKKSDFSKKMQSALEGKVEKTRVGAPR